VADGLIARELCAAVLVELVEGAMSGTSPAARWLGEITRPPEGVSFDAPSTYSGVVLIVRNEIRRAWLLDHQTRPQWKPSRHGPPDGAYPYFD
jgi:hypothetical protein